MQSSRIPTIVSFAMSAALLGVTGWLGRGGFLSLFAFLGAAVFTVGACDMAVRAYRTRGGPSSESPE